MNKKFSTLMASFLLASAFSTTAWAADFTPKAGEFARLTIATASSGETRQQSGSGSTFITISDGKLVSSTAAATGTSENYGWDKVFSGVRSQIWKVAKVTKSSSSENTYQFVNKQTGEYLAVKLQTNAANYTTQGAVAINAAGNKDWSMAGDALYAFNAKRDSIFFLTVDENNNIGLKSIATNDPNASIGGNAKIGFNQIIGNETPSNDLRLSLGAEAFNALMKLTGNDGKLHFNGGKDVTSTQKNALTGVKWTAIDIDGDAIYLWNGKTKESGAKKQRPYCLMVDTAYYDAVTPAFYKLTTDTLSLTKNNNGTYSADGSDVTPVQKRPAGAAQFTATYFFGNDSIALAANNLPKVQTNGEFAKWVDGKCSVDLMVTAGAGGDGTSEEPATPDQDAASGNITERFTLRSNTEAVTSPFPIALRSLADVTVLTVNVDGGNGYVSPLIQPYATAGGDATEIKTAATVYNLKIKNTDKAYKPMLRAVSYANKYLVAVDDESTDVVADVDASNVFAQWALLPGEAGSYSIVNRATELVYYAGPVSVVKDADGKVVKNTYTLGTDTLELAAVELNADNVYEETVDKKKVKYDYSGTFYAGTGDMAYKSFEINPVAAFISSYAVCFDEDSVLILDKEGDAQVWRFKEGKSITYGLEIEGIPSLKAKTYNIYAKDANNNVYYIYENEEEGAFAITKSDSENAPAEFLFVNVLDNQYKLLSLHRDDDGDVEEEDVVKMTINPTPERPILEVSDADAEKTDLFTISKAEVNKYRTLTAEDGVLGNAKIFMNNETSRYLYENTANIVANNGNKIAKDSLNFLGIFNTAAMTKNAALYVDTAYVDRVDNTRPQYMFAVGVEEFEAHDAIACSYEHNHFDNAGNKVDALHCSHATPATLGYKAGRYLVSLNDSIDGVNNHPGRYDGATRLAFVEAIHRNAEDSLIIKNSKWTDNSKQIVEGEETTYASKDTVKISNDLNVATFALLIKDQADQSFYLETAKDKDGKVQYVRILNGVPVLTSSIADAAVFNIEATTEEATANEAIEAAGVQVIGGQGAVTVQGAAGKVITVANILGQTIANQVAASDNVTIAAPAGIVVVAVEGEATKVVVK